jgi:hypothetical protein
MIIDYSPHSDFMSIFRDFALIDLKLLYDTLD